MLTDKLVERYKDYNSRQRKEIRTYKSNVLYKNIISLNILSYLNSEDKNMQIAALFRIENEDFFNDSWRRKEDRSCRI